MNWFIFLLGFLSLSLVLWGSEPAHKNAPNSQGMVKAEPMEAKPPAPMPIIYYMENDPYPWHCDEDSCIQNKPVTGDTKGSITFMPYCPNPIECVRLYYEKKEVPEKISVNMKDCDIRLNGNMEWSDQQILILVRMHEACMKAKKEKRP